MSTDANFVMSKDSKHVNVNTEKSYDFVDHPAHYTKHPKGIECIDVVEDLSFNIGSAIKYLWRAGQKPGANIIEDLKKALWYVERERLRQTAIQSKKEIIKNSTNATREVTSNHGSLT